MYSGIAEMRLPSLIRPLPKVPLMPFVCETTSEMWPPH